MLEEQPIFVAGMPRAGSMWTYNVVRRLVALAGKAPWPEKVPPDERSVIEEAFSRSAGPGQVYCIKTHYAIPPDRPGIKILCNFRDIRDSTLSFMRFMKCPFSAALESARESMKITDHYLRSGSLSVLPVDYDDVIGAPVALVARIARFIGVKADGQEIAEIIEQLSRERMAAKLDKLKSVAVDSSGAIMSESEAANYTSVRNIDGSFRVYDYETGFQSNHITSSRPGEWREAFTLDQQRALNDLLGEWLRQYGYEL